MSPENQWLGSMYFLLKIVPLKRGHVSFRGNNPLILTGDPKFLEHASRQDPVKDCLVGGWTTHRKNISQIRSSPQEGVNKKKFNWTPPAETMKSSGDMLLQLLYLTYLK